MTLKNADKISVIGVHQRPCSLLVGCCSQCAYEPEEIKSVKAWIKLQVHLSDSVTV